MKFSIDTDNKLIELEGEANIKELWEFVNNFANPDQFKVTFKQTIPQQPLIKSAGTRDDNYYPPVKENKPNFESLKVNEDLEKMYADSYGKGNNGSNGITFAKT